MEINTAVTALAALAHHSRLAIFRLLVQAGSAGMAAGQISATAGDKLLRMLDTYSKAVVLDEHERRLQAIEGKRPKQVGLLRYDTEGLV